MSGPEATELGQPGIDLLKRFRFESIETALRVRRGFHKACLAEHPEVLRDGGLRHAQLTLDVSYRLLGRDQQAQDRATVRFSDDFERGFHDFNIP